MDSREIRNKLLPLAAELAMTTEDAILSRQRTVTASRGRFYLFVGLRSVGMTVVEIGAICNRDHSTVTGGLWRIEKRAQYDKQVRKHLAAMRYAASELGKVDALRSPGGVYSRLNAIEERLDTLNELLGGIISKLEDRNENCTNHPGGNGRCSCDNRDARVVQQH